MRWLAAAAFLGAAWLVGLVVYADSFSETERSGGEALLVAAWIAAVLAVACTAAGVVASVRARRVRRRAR